jgi:polar amino acid transport system substrate-binding protein
MKMFLLLTLFAALTLVFDSASAQAPSCGSLTITGHPEYPPIGYRDGERIVGAGATLVERIAADLEIPVVSKYTGSWAEAQTAAREGKVDIIFGSNRGKRPGGQACARHRLTRSGRRGTSVSAALSLAPR